MSQLKFLALTIIVSFAIATPNIALANDAAPHSKVRKALPHKLVPPLHCRHWVRVNGVWQCA